MTGRRDQQGPGDADDRDGARRPTLRIVSGDATPEEIAAVLAVVCARSSAVLAQEVAQENAAVWPAPTHGHRRSRAVYHAHRHGWRTSYWPH